MHLPLLLALLLASGAAAPALEKSKTSGATAAYQWTEEPKTAETATWLTQQIVAAQVNEQPKIAQGLTDLLRTSQVAAPCSQEGVFFFVKRGPGEKAASIYRRAGLAGVDEPVIDAAKVGAKDPALTIFDLSNDGKVLAYGVSEGKAAEPVVRFFDLPAGRDLPDTLPRARYNTVSVGPENNGAWYAKVAPEGTRIFFHEFGGAGEDKYVFGETYNYEPLGQKDLISTEVTPSGEHLLLSVRRGAEAKRTDVYAQELEKPDEKIRPIIYRMNSRFAWVAHAGDIYVLTDHDAPKQRVVQVVIDDPNPLNWKTIVAEGDEMLTGIARVGERLYVTSDHAGGAQTRIFTLEGKETGKIISPKFAFAQRVHHTCGAD